MTRKIFAALALSSALALPASAFDISDMTEGEKAAFGEAVRDYLMENPEVLIESINVLEQRQQEQEAQDDVTLVETNAKDIFEDGYSWVGGNPEGDVTMVEFLDYRCGYCKKAYEAVEKLLKEDGNIRFIVKEFPILGDQSDLAARFAVAVQQIAGEDSYEDIHNQLMAFRGDITMDSLKRLAETNALDADAIIKRMNEEPVTAVLRQNHQLAARLKVSGTPAFVIGTEMMRGYAPYETMAAIVDSQRD